LIDNRPTVFFGRVLDGPLAGRRLSTDRTEYVVALPPPGLRKASLGGPLGEALVGTVTYRFTPGPHAWSDGTWSLAP
jgi:hypothetical protein